MPEQLELQRVREFPKLMVVTPYLGAKTGFSTEQETLMRQVNGLQAFNMITNAGSIVAVLNVWHTHDMVYICLWDVSNHPTYQVGISKREFKRGSGVLVNAIAYMLAQCGMKFFTLRDEIAATSSAIASLV